MSSIRTRLTMAYAAALMGTMAAFAITLWSARRASATEDVQRAVFTEANVALNIVRETERNGQAVVIPTDTLGDVVITPMLRTLLEGIPDYLVILDSEGRLLYLSFAARQLDDNAIAQLEAAAGAASTTGPAEIVTVGGQPVLLAARGPQTPGSAISRVAVAASLGSADARLRELLGTMLAVAPLLLIASITVAYAIAGRAFTPVERMINEVEAITDGRSLHRRLPQETAGDEIARLAVTLNEMMGRLEKSFGALRRFTADASHELKTPLAVIRADVERSMNDEAPRSERLIALEEALHETARMSDLVDGLLTLARADERRFDLHREPVDLESVVREVYETAAILGEAAELTVTMPEPPHVMVLGDLSRLRQLLLNLATNAIKYTPRGGSVELTLARHGRTASVSVRDTGVGISAADLPHVFERFFRADRVRSRSSERGGFGLGLAISQWIAEAHGGSIAVRSRLTRGSTFTVTLPVLEEPPAAAPATATSQAD